MKTVCNFDPEDLKAKVLAALNQSLTPVEAFEKVKAEEHIDGKLDDNENTVKFIFWYGGGDYIFSYVKKGETIWENVSRK